MVKETGEFGGRIKFTKISDASLPSGKFTFSLSISPHYSPSLSTQSSPLHYPPDLLLLLLSLFLSVTVFLPDDNLASFLGIGNVTSPLSLAHCVHEPPLIFKGRSGPKNGRRSSLIPILELQWSFALSLEKLTNEKLLKLHEVATENNDVQLLEFVEGFLVE